MIASLDKQYIRHTAKPATSARDKGNSKQEEASQDKSTYQSIQNSKVIKSTTRKSMAEEYREAGSPVKG